MQVQIVLESPHTVFTNLDYVRGKVILLLPSLTAISSIIVKLEGESRTRMMSPGRPDIGERPQPREELHKVLYKLQTVLSPDGKDPSFTGSSYYTLQPGRYEYHFQMKIPFNNSCFDAPPTTDVDVLGLRLQMARPNLRHVKTTLPPTVTAFPGLAEIRYFLKCTVKRKEFYKENARVIQHINFLPIEPPRNPPNSSESYARRQHNFAVPNPHSSGQSDPKSRGLFGRKQSGPGRMDSNNPPVITVDARLPNPAILTCNQDIPLRLLVNRLNDSTDPIYLQSLQIELIGHTHVRAHDVFRNENSSWVIVSYNNMNITIDDGSPVANATESRPKAEDTSKAFTINAAAWHNKPLPISVAPSFETCNISRNYELVIKVGIGYGFNPAQSMVVLPLHMPVNIYSGVRPPPELLAAMRSGQNPVTKKPLSATAQSNVASVQASTYNQPGSSRPPQPPRPLQPPTLPAEEEPPPSYEDAIAQDLPPIDGPRNYQPPPLAANNGGFPEEKRRRDS